uniref:Uncharacterized protein n=1 Tax=Parascaris univalens TaxID=6257 RepID=A0A915AW16_PARUN
MNTTDLFLDQLLETNFVQPFLFLKGLSILLQDISWRKCVPIYATISVGALPKPAIFTVFHSFNEILTYNIRLIRPLPILLAMFLFGHFI